MIDARGNLWTFPADVRVITTNGTIKKDGSCVMGRGCAAEARQRYSGIDKVLGNHLKLNGNHVALIWGAAESIYSFPVKHNWFERADIKLIARSAMELVDLIDIKMLRVVMPRPGCGNGHLRWADVKPILEPILDDRFHIITF